MGKQNLFPLSMFDSVRKPSVSDFEEMDFADFIETMSSYSEEQYSSKEAAPLFAATEFKNGKRSKANATTSGLIILDVDDGQTIEDTWSIVEELGVSAILYSTASHRNDHHKFRLCIPLMEAVSYEQHRKCWHYINHAFLDGQSDGSKIGCESLFYVPGQYPKAPSVFLHNDGDILSVDEWAEIVDMPEALEQPVEIVVTRQSGDGAEKSSLQSASSSDLDIYETKLVTEAALNKYQSSIGDWHHARFGLMMSIVGRAKRLGIAITTYDIIHLFNQVDQLDGGHYQTPKYQKEIANDAANALAQAV